MGVGLILKDWRISKGYSVIEMARLVEVSPQTIYNTENGKNKPSSKYLEYYILLHNKEGF